MEGDVITMQGIFLFEKLGVSQEGKVIGRFRATGVRPKVGERLHGGGGVPADMLEGSSRSWCSLSCGCERSREVFLFFTRLPRWSKRRQLELVFRKLSRPDETPDRSVQSFDGARRTAAPWVEKLIGATRAGSHLSRLIEQAG